MRSDRDLVDPGRSDRDPIGIRPLSWRSQKIAVFELNSKLFELVGSARSDPDFSDRSFA